MTNCAAEQNVARVQFGAAVFKFHDVIAEQSAAMPWHASRVFRVLACVPALAPDAGHQGYPFGLLVERLGALGRRLELGAAGPQLGADGA